MSAKPQVQQVGQVRLSLGVVINLPIIILFPLDNDLAGCTPQPLSYPGSGT